MNREEVQQAIGKLLYYVSFNQRYCVKELETIFNMALNEPFVRSFSPLQFMRWTVLYQSINDAYQRSFRCEDKYLPHLESLLEVFQHEINRIEADEGPTDENIAKEAQGDENEFLWGPGIRTYEQVMAEVEKLG